MKKLFMFLLKKYSKSEADRLLIHSVLHEQVCETYNEQTIYGNVYNSYIEFLMANKTIINAVKENDDTVVQMIKHGLNSNFSIGINYIKNKKYEYC